MCVCMRVCGCLWFGWLISIFVRAALFANYLIAKKCASDVFFLALEMLANLRLCGCRGACPLGSMCRKSRRYFMNQASDFAEWRRCLQWVQSLRRQNDIKQEHALHTGYSREIRLNDEGIHANIYVYIVKRLIQLHIKPLFLLFTCNAPSLR